MQIGSRQTQRATFELPVRVSLLEHDADEAESTLGKILEGQQRIVWWAMGVVASLCTASVLLTLNLIH